VEPVLRLRGAGDFYIDEEGQDGDGAVRHGVTNLPGWSELRFADLHVEGVWRR